MHRSLPERSLNQIDLTTTIAGIKLRTPVIINAMTGGAPGVAAINRDLAQIAGQLGLAMALGSQTAGLRDSTVVQSYQVVRSVNPQGIILANVGADVAVDDAQRAIDMVEANLLQLHLNAPQELMMAEGDRDFSGMLANIAAIVRAVPVPVIVKECGFGLGRESARQLHSVGVQAIDISGRGGTNFVWIEAERGTRVVDPGLLHWGIPSAAALAEVAALGLPDCDLIASGGILFGSHAAKALALGAHAVGIAGEVLRHLQSGGVDAATNYLNQLHHDLKCAMLLAGASNVQEMARCSVVITGQIGEWCRLRGVPLERLANRT